MRKLIVEIKKSNCEDLVRYELEEKPRMSILIVLEEIQENLDPELYYEAVCGSSICGSCAIKINGQPMLACKTQTKDLPERIKLEPLDFFPLIKDLATDKAQFFTELNRTLEAWVHRKKEFNPEKEGLMSDEKASELYVTEQCIECGICISACAAASCGKFIGATGSSKGLRFALDPRNEDKNVIKKLVDILASDKGLWGCHGIGACKTFCPKELPLTSQLALARKTFLKIILKKWFKKIF